MREFSKVKVSIFLILDILIFFTFKYEYLNFQHRIYIYTFIYLFKSKLFHINRSTIAFLESDGFKKMPIFLFVGSFTSM